MRTALDTNVLLDLLAGDGPAIRAARTAITEALQVGSVAISPVVCAELAANFADQNEFYRFLADFHIQRDDFSMDALLQAAASWRRYARGRGQSVQCPRCGTTEEVHCRGCGFALSWRQHILTDFLVGGHAAAQADQLLTRDRGYYRRYFPDLKVVTP